MLIEENLLSLERISGVISERNLNVKKMQNILQSVREQTEDLFYLKIYCNTLHQFEKKEEKRKELELSLLKSIQTAYEVSQ